MGGIVYVVHCVDTEGPLYETPTVPFEQIRNIFGIEIEPSRENLILLQNGKLNLNGLEEAVRNLVDIHRITTRGTWEEINEMLSCVTSREFRMKLPDSAGNGWLFNWFCMDHVGFTGENPRRRHAGYHKIFDKYAALVKKQGSEDFIGFHYHPLPLSGNYNDSGTTYWGSNINEILARKIIDRNWFPSAFRPGFHTERPDSHWFLEQWIPFDYGNQSTYTEETGQADLSCGRFGDWRRAPLDWIPYHPDHDDYQVKGGCRRWITRCLNMYARTRQLSQCDVDDAFRAASEGRDVILSFTDHDYKDMEFEISRVREMLEVSHRKNPDVKFIYSNAVDAMRKTLGLEHQDFFLDAVIDMGGPHGTLLVTVQGEIFGPQPFLALKTKDGRYIWENLDVQVPGKQWSYTFDSNTVAMHTLEKLGIAANNRYGITRIIRLDSQGNKEMNVYNL